MKNIKIKTFFKDEICILQKEKKKTKKKTPDFHLFLNLKNQVETKKKLNLDEFGKIKKVKYQKNDLNTEKFDIEKIKNTQRNFKFSKETFFKKSEENFNILKIAEEKKVKKTRFDKNSKIKRISFTVKTKNTNKPLKKEKEIKSRNKKTLKFKDDLKSNGFKGKVKEFSRSYKHINKKTIKRDFPDLIKLKKTLKNINESRVESNNDINNKIRQNEFSGNLKKFNSDTEFKTVKPQLENTLRYAFNKNKKAVFLKLTPRHLGNIEVSIFTVDKKTKVEIKIQKHETLQLFLDNKSEIKNLFSEIKKTGNDISFDFNKKHENSSQNKQKNNAKLKINKKILNNFQNETINVYAGLIEVFV